MAKKSSASVFWFVVSVLVLFGFVYVFTRHVVVSQSQPVMTLSFLDVGQGDAVYIETPSGAKALVDGGRGSVVMEELGMVMPFFERKLDAVFLTHPDADHAEGLFDVMKYVDVGNLFDTGFPEADRTDELYYDFADKYEIPRKALSQGDEVVLDESYGVTLEVLWPPVDYEFGGDINESSLVLLLRYGDFEALLTGDAGVMTEQEVLKRYGNDIDVDILKLGHHGSKTSSSEQFLIASSPDVAIVQAGADSPYGHPHKIVTDRAAYLGIPVLCTCTSGRITFEIDVKGKFAKKSNFFE